MKCLIAGCLILSGCVNHEVTPKSIEVSTNYCVDNGGLSKIEEASPGDELFKGFVRFTCNNGASFKKRWGKDGIPLNY
jgi:hypothetical protein